MAYTADELFDYMADISTEVDDKYGSGYSTEEERQAYYKRIYEALEARETSQDTLWDVDEDILNDALDIMENENYHGESTALIAYMYKKYGWEPLYGIEQEKDFAPFLYE